MSEISSQYIESLLIKELAFAYPDIVSAYSSNNEDMVESVVESLETELCRVCDNIELIHPNELEGASLEMMKDASARSVVSECIKEIGTNLASAINEHGKEELLSCIDPVKTDPILYSERIGLSGMPAKLVCHDGNVVPSVIKTGKYPENGVWNNDNTEKLLNMVLWNTQDMALSERLLFELMTGGRY
jgi:CRISPR-associated exonuclease Cas4